MIDRPALPSKHGAKPDRLVAAAGCSLVLHLVVVFGLVWEQRSPPPKPALKPLRIEFLGNMVKASPQPRQADALAEMDQQAGSTARERSLASPATALPLPAVSQPDTVTPVAPPAPPPTPMVRPRVRAERMVPEQDPPARRAVPLAKPAERLDLNPLSLKMTPTLGEVAAWDAKFQEESRRRELEADGAVDLNTRQVKYASYFRGIKQRIEQVWSYPSQAKKNQQSGNLLLEFTLDRDGHMVEIELLHTSGVNLLDDAAIKAIRKAGPFPPLPREWQKDKLRVKVTFEYLMRKLQW